MYLLIRCLILCPGLIRSNICPSNNDSISTDKRVKPISRNVVSKSVFTCNTIFGITVSKSLPTIKI